MTYRPKRKAPPVLTKKLIQAALAAQAPPDHEWAVQGRKKPRKWAEDGLDGIGGGDGDETD